MRWWALWRWFVDFDAVVVIETVFVWMRERWKPQFMIDSHQLK